jgi:hypothetical protein
MLARQKVILTLTGASILFVGCSSMYNQADVNNDQLAKMQTKTIDASKQNVYVASLATLEDAAFIVNSADYLPSNDSPAFIAATNQKIALNISIRKIDNSQSQVRISAFDLSHFYANQVISGRSSRYSIPVIGGIFAFWDWLFIRQKTLTDREDGIIDDPVFYDEIYSEIYDRSILDSVNDTYYS